jgi:hypothetical protein
MLRTSNLARPAVALASLTVAFTLQTPGLAAVAAGGSPPVSTAGLATPPNIITTQYSCDLSAFANSAPVTVSGTLSFAGSVAAGSALIVTLDTPGVSLPSSVLGQLPGMVSVDLVADLTAEHASAASVPLNATSPVSGTLTGLPASKATGLVTFPGPGTGVITVPSMTLTFTPHQGNGILRAITCTTKAAARDVPVTVTPSAAGTAGPQSSTAGNGGHAGTGLQQGMTLEVTVPSRAPGTGATGPGGTPITGTGVPGGTPNGGAAVPGGMPNAGAALPAGAPGTGGGPGPVEDLALAAGGLALVLCGGGLVFLGWRRQPGS